MKQRRFLSLLITIVLCLSMFSIGAAANDGSAPPPAIDGAGGVQARLDAVYEAYPAGTVTSGTFEAGGSTCFGFAKMVIYRVFGKKGSSFREWNYSGGGRVGMNLIGQIETCTADNVRALMMKAKPGDVLQFDRGEGVQHTMIVWSVNSTGVTIYENNWTANTVTRTFETFAQLAARQKRWNGTMRGALSLLRADNYDEIEGPEVVTVPSAPVITEVAAQSSSSLLIRWSASSGAASYRLERCEEGSGEYVMIAFGLTATSYTDTGLNADTRYYYRAIAVNSAGMSDRSEAVSGKTNSQSGTAATASPAPTATAAPAPTSAPTPAPTPSPTPKPASTLPPAPLPSADDAAAILRAVVNGNTSMTPADAAAILRQLRY